MTRAGCLNSGTTTTVSPLTLVSSPLTLHPFVGPPPSPFTFVETHHGCFSGFPEIYCPLSQSN